MPDKGRTTAHGHALHLRSVAIVLALGAAIAAPANAAEKPEDAAAARAAFKFDVVANAAHLVDETAKLTIADVRRLPDRAFVSDLAREINLGLSTTALWIKLDTSGFELVRNDLVLVVPNPTLDYVSVYFQVDGGQIVQHGGDRIPFAARPLQHRLHVFPLPAETPRIDAIYIEVSGASSLRVEAFIQDRLGLAHSEARRLLLSGAFFGLMSALFLYNLFVSVAVREFGHFHYLGYLLSATAIAAIVDGFPAYFGAWPWWPVMANEIAIVTAHALLLCGTNFVHSYLREDDSIANVDYRLIWLRRFVVASAILSALLGDHASQRLLLLAVMVTISILAMTIAHHAIAGVRQARILTIVFSGLALPTALWLGGASGYVEGSATQLSTLQIGFALEAILLSIALADRINHYRETRRQAEHRLLEDQKSFAKQLLFAQDHERGTVARDLHDSIGQNVLALKARLDRWAKHPDPATASHHAEASRIAGKIATSARELAHRLHPSILGRLGLARALTSLMTALADMGIRIDINLPPTINAIERETALMIYRIFQEAIANVIKHADANHCVFSATADDSCAIFDFADDGCGRSAEVCRHASLGVQSMMERANMIGAHLAFTDVENGGIRVRLTLGVQPGIHRPTKP